MKLVIVVALLAVVVAGSGTTKEKCASAVGLATKALEPVVENEQKRHKMVDLIRRQVKKACTKTNECETQCFKDTFVCLDDQYKASTVVISGDKCCKNCAS